MAHKRSMGVEMTITIITPSEITRHSRRTCRLWIMSGTALAMAKVVSQLAAVVSVRPLPRRRWGKISAAT